MTQNNPSESISPASTSTAGLVAEYLNYLGNRKNRSELTLDSYKNDLDQFLAFLQAAPEEMDIAILALDPDVADRFAGSLKTQYTASTLSRKITAVRGFYGYLLDTQRLTANPFDGIHLRAPEPVDVDYLEEAHLQQLFDAITGSHWLSFRDRAIVAVLYSTGMRVGELLALTHADTDAETSALTIRTPGRATRRCPLPPWAWSTLERYIDRRPAASEDSTDNASAVLFVNRNGDSLTARSVRRKLCEYSRRAGLPVEATPAVLRHSCAIHMLRRGTDVKAVRRLLGHLSTSSMRPYLACLAEHPDTAPDHENIQIAAH